MIEGAKNLVALSDLVCVGVPCHVKSIGRVGVLGFSLWCFRCTFLLTLKSTSVTIVSLKNFEHQHVVAIECVFSKGHLILCKP